MIEATCTACGNINRVDDDEVPVGAKFIGCTTCNARVAIPVRTARGPALRPPAASSIGLADLPAPKRASPLGAESSKPAPRSGLAAALDGDLPAPKAGRAGSSMSLELDDLFAPAGADARGPAGIVDLPAPKAGGSRAPTSEPREVSDLPAPKATRSTGDFAVVKPIAETADLPAPKPRAIADLPAPKLPPKLPPFKPPFKPPSISKPAAGKPGALPTAPRPSAAQGVPADLPAPRPFAADLPVRSGAGEIADLPTPKPAGITDLPAPKGPAGIIDLPAPKGPGEIADLPAPKRPAEVTDLLAPRPFETGLDELLGDPMPDLPAPKRGADPIAPREHTVRGVPPPGRDNTMHDVAAAGRGDTMRDVPQVRTGQTRDLPPPPPPAGIVDLPMPKPGAQAELPAPKGFFDDLPQPATAATAASRSPELPAPKGFFDDLPQPATAATAAAAAARNPELPAPKGFFEDLPQPATAATAAAAARNPGLPAPKGFFDDLPGRPNAGARADRPEPPAPKGFFEDLPGRPNTTGARPERPEPPAPKGFFDDLPGRPNTTGARPDRPEPPAPKGFFDDLPQPSRNPVGPPAPVGPLDLRNHGQFDELELARPSSGGAVRIDTPQTASVPPPLADRDAPAATFRPSDSAIELAEPRALPVPGRADDGEPDAPEVDPAVLARRRIRRRRRIAIAGLLVVVLGAGGVFAWRRQTAARARAQAAAELLATARKAMTAGDQGHWLRAANAARKIVEELDPHHPAALGLGAEALFAVGLADGINAAGNFAKGRKLLATAREDNASGPELERAIALQWLTANQPDRAMPRLEALSKQAPQDLVLRLYVGWGHAQRGELTEAIAAFDQATASPATRTAALYGRGQARLAQADLAGARADFAAVLELAKDHLGAQVGIALAQPAAQAQQQEADLLAILQRKDLAAGDQRAVIQAWVLAADAAARGGRLDAARERYRKALAIVALDVGALTGLAEVELRDDKLDLAIDLITKATTQAKDNVRAQLVAAEIEIRQKRLDIAGQRLELLAGRAPPPPTLERARLQLITGQLLEARGDDAGAVDAYEAAAQLAGELDLVPTLAAIAKLSALEAQATADNAPERARALHERADRLLGALADNALKDPHLALTLGTAYLQAGDPVKAEPWLRRVVEQRGSVADSHYHLAKALVRLARFDEAIDELRKASAIEPARAEIGLELARTFELSRRDGDAGELYGKLLAGKEPSIELRARAGRFYARTGQLERAAAEGARILEVEPEHPTGLFLKAEGVLAAGRTDDARKLFTQAVDGERDAQFLDGQGRAAERHAAESGDTRYQDVALRAYAQATELAPDMFNPLAGQGRLHVIRHEAAKAVPPLLAASRLRPDDGDVAYLIGAAYKELVQVPTAIEWLKRATALKPTALAGWALGQLYYDSNQPQLAAAALAGATQLALDEEKRTGKPIGWLTDALYIQGRVNNDMHDDARARDAWERYIARNPPKSAQRDEVVLLLATALKRR